METTINKDTKTPGGMTGFSTNTGAAQRWDINASYRAALRICFQQHLQYQPNVFKHKDLSLSRILKDEADVNAVLSIFNDLFINPFD